MKIEEINAEYEDLFKMSKMLMDQVDTMKAQLEEQDTGVTPGGGSEVAALNAQLSDLQEQIHAQDGELTQAKISLEQKEKELSELLKTNSSNSTDLQKKLQELQQNVQILTKENSD